MKGRYGFIPIAFATLVACSNKDASKSTPGLVIDLPECGNQIIEQGETCDGDINGMKVDASVCENGQLICQSCQLTCVPRPNGCGDVSLGRVAVAQCVSGQVRADVCPPGQQRRCVQCQWTPCEDLPPEPQCEPNERRCRNGDLRICSSETNQWIDEPCKTDHPCNDETVQCEKHELLPCADDVRFYSRFLAYDPDKKRAYLIGTRNYEASCLIAQVDVTHDVQFIDLAVDDAKSVVFMGQQKDNASFIYSFYHLPDLTPRWVGETPFECTWPLGAVLTDIYDFTLGLVCRTNRGKHDFWHMRARNGALDVASDSVELTNSNVIDMVYDGSNTLLLKSNGEVQKMGYGREVQSWQLTEADDVTARRIWYYEDGYAVWFSTGGLRKYDRQFNFLSEIALDPKAEILAFIAWEDRFGAEPQFATIHGRKLTLIDYAQGTVIAERLLDEHPRAAVYGDGDIFVAMDGWIERYSSRLQVIYRGHEHVIALPGIQYMKSLARY